MVLSENSAIAPSGQQPLGSSPEAVPCWNEVWTGERRDKEGRRGSPRRKERSGERREGLRWEDRKDGFGRYWRRKEEA
jgi:hypothetical protein